MQNEFHNNRAYFANNNKMTDDGQNLTPRSLDCSNISMEWPKWKQNFTVWMIATGKMDKPEKNKIATFIWLIGEQGTTNYNTLFLNDGSQNSMLGEIRAGDAFIQRSLDEVIKKFDKYCLPQKNVAMESFKFNMISQKEKQSFNEFETELRKQLSFCNFKCECGALYEERMLRDGINIGVHDKKRKLKLLDGRDEALAKVLETCKIYESANVNKSILEFKTTVVASIATEEIPQPVAVNAINRFCFNCGWPWNQQHVNVCKAKNGSCRICSKKGHFDKFCRQRGKN